MRNETKRYQCLTISSRRTVDMLSLWCWMLMCATSYFRPHSCFAVTWTCQLNFLPVERIPLSPSKNSLLAEKADEGGRHLRSRSPENNDAFLGVRPVALPMGSIERRTGGEQTPLHGVLNDSLQDNTDGTTASLIFDPSEINDSDTSQAAESTAYQEGRLCACAVGLLDTKYHYYCPMTTDHCSVWRRRYTNQYGVTCYDEKGWKVGFAREIWYYLCLALSMLLLYPIFTRPGQHTIKYALSKCFPRMNSWITEQLLQNEIEAHNIMMNEFERAARLKRRTEGWVSGYSLKTKRYSCSTGRDVAAKKRGEENVNIDDNDTNLSGNDGNNTGDQISSEAPQDQCHTDDDCMCTICLLALADGDRIADLSCGHMYHADCLGEWIVKKNSCPLCQNEGIAKEIRSFETDDDDPIDRNSANLGGLKSAVSRCLSQIRESVVNIATGGNNWRRDIRIYRTRIAMNESQ